MDDNLVISLVKEFLKPNKWKVGFAFLFSALTVGVLLAGNVYLLVIYLKLPFYVTTSAYLSYLFFPLDALRPYPSAFYYTLIPLVAGFISDFIYFYLLSCFIYFIFTAIRDFNSKSIVERSNRKIIIAILMTLALIGSVIFSVLNNDETRKTSSRIAKTKTTYGIFEPTYIPEGWEKQYETEYEDKISWGYTCSRATSTRGFLFVSQTPLEKTTERLSTVKDHYYRSGFNYEISTVNGKEAIIRKSSTATYHNTLTWETDNTFIQIVAWEPCLLPKEELIKIGESIR